jgi:hypothetical protein
MNAVPFDTLKMAQRLETAGFSGPQAAGAAEALAEALVGADLATKGDLVALEGRLRGDVTSVRGDLTSLEAKMLTAIELLRRDMTIKLGGLVFIAVGVLLAAMRYLPPHP